MKSRVLLYLIPLLILSACTAVSLAPANFAWPIENVLRTDDQGNVAIDRYSTEFNSSNLFKEEFGDSADYVGKEIRIIRDHLGYYFMTSVSFKYVYVFEIDDGAFEQVDKIFITEDGLKNPAFNQREPNIELLDGDKTYTINSQGSVR